MLKDIADIVKSKVVKTVERLPYYLQIQWLSRDGKFLPAVNGGCRFCRGDERKPRRKHCVYYSPSFRAQSD